MIYTGITVKGVTIELICYYEINASLRTSLKAFQSQMSQTQLNPVVTFPRTDNNSVDKSFQFIYSPSLC